MTKEEDDLFDVDRCPDTLDMFEDEIIPTKSKGLYMQYIGRFKGK